MYILTSEIFLLGLLSSGVFGGFLPQSAPSSNHTSVTNSSSQVSGPDTANLQVVDCQSELVTNPCDSKTSVRSCAKAATDVCNQVAAEKGAKNGRISSTSGTCRATVLTTHTNPSLKDCTTAFQSISDQCIAPGENSNPSKSLPNMRGWVNANLDICIKALDESMPFYQLGASSCDKSIQADDLATCYDSRAFDP